MRIPGHFVVLSRRRTRTRTQTHSSPLNSLRLDFELTFILITRNDHVKVDEEDDQRLPVPTRPLQLLSTLPFK